MDFRIADKVIGIGTLVAVLAGVALCGYGAWRLVGGRIADKLQQSTEADKTEKAAKAEEREAQVRAAAKKRDDDARRAAEDKERRVQREKAKQAAEAARAVKAKAAEDAQERAMRRHEEQEEYARAKAAAERKIMEDEVRKKNQEYQNQIRVQREVFLAHIRKVYRDSVKTIADSQGILERSGREMLIYRNRLIGVQPRDPSQEDVVELETRARARHILPEWELQKSLKAWKKNSDDFAKATSDAATAKQMLDAIALEAKLNNAEAVLTELQVESSGGGGTKDAVNRGSSGGVTKLYTLKDGTVLRVRAAISCDGKTRLRLDDGTQRSVLQDDIAGIEDAVKPVVSGGGDVKKGGGQ